MQDGLRTFFIIWVGQLVSNLGSRLTAFALGLWLFQETGSVTLFALNNLAFVLPTILLSPFAGVLADRWDRRWVMVLSDAGAGLSTLAIFLLLATDSLAVWHIYLVTAVSSLFTVFQWPAYTASTTMLIPKDQLGRASGLTQMSQAIAQLAGPAIAGALFIFVGLNGIILIDFVTFGVAVFTLLVIRIPQPKVSAESRQEQGSYLREARYGWTYLRQRPGLMALLFYYASVNFALSMIGPLILPMLMNMVTADVVGYATSVSGSGMLLGTLVMSAWGGPKRRVRGILLLGLVLGAGGVVMGIRPFLWLIVSGSFLSMFVVPIMSGSSQALWQTKVAADVQGRVFAVRRMIASAMSPLGITLAGPLADRVFEPLMAVDGRLANSAGQLIGSGPGRGTAVLFILIGCFVIGASLIAGLFPRLRRLESEIPDVLIEKAKEGGEETAAIHPATTG